MAVETSQVQAAPTAARPEEFRATEPYRYYVVWFLFVVYVFNFVDRQILTTLIEPIKNEFELHDWQLGALSGTAFALFYTTFGIPIARWADKSNRVNIIALSLLIWSSATAVTASRRPTTYQVKSAVSAFPLLQRTPSTSRLATPAPGR